MVCDTRLFSRNQTLTERKEQVKKAVDRLSAALAAGKVKPKVDKKTGGIAFEGWNDRDGVTDGCAWRRILGSGSAAAKAAIAKAEALAGRQVNKEAVAQGVHSHDGGKTWHHGH